MIQTLIDNAMFLAFFFYDYRAHLDLHSFPTRRSSDLRRELRIGRLGDDALGHTRRAERCPIDLLRGCDPRECLRRPMVCRVQRSEEHTSELQSRGHLVCRPLLEKKKENQ